MKNKLIILFCLISFVVGTAVCWWCVRRHFLHFPPFDRALYDEMSVDFAPLSYMSIRGDGTNRHYWVGLYRPEREVSASEFHTTLKRLAQVGSNETICISVSPRTTVGEVQNLMRQAKEDGCTGARFLVESDPPQADDAGIPIVKELRIGPARGLVGHQYEWYLELERNILFNNERVGTSP